MKKTLYIILSIIMIFTIPGCNEPEVDNPGEVVVNFLNAMMAQDYTHAKSYYTEDLDNIPNFRNKLEAVSPLVANEFFSKIADFNYTTKKVALDSSNPNKAYVTVNIQPYDLQNFYRAVFTDYIKIDLEMTFDGASEDQITKEAEDTLLSTITMAPLSYYKTIVISLTRVDKVWKLDKLSENKELLDVLSGNMLSAIEDFQTE